MLYAITSSPQQIKAYFAHNIPWVQFRNKSDDWPEKLALGNNDQKLVVNDSLEYALKVGAWGVHLGQEDLQKHTKAQLLSRTIGLGISTHSLEELDLALKYNPDYVAFGPVFKTSSKQLAYSPQGLEMLRRVVSISSVPVIAIGGIECESYREVLETGVIAVAMIGALQKMSAEEVGEWYAGVSG